MIHNYGRKLAGTKYINYALTTFSISQSKRAEDVGADNYVKYVCITGRDERTSIVHTIRNRKNFVIRGKLLCSASWAKSP